VRHQSATVHELARIGLLAGVPADELRRMGERMERRELAPGEHVLDEGEEGDRFYVVLSGMLAAVQAGSTGRGVLRPGDYFGEVALLRDVPRAASVKAVTPATVASCDRETFDEFVRPLFSY
jgi:ATP-binding cassette subfamily B protein